MGMFESLSEKAKGIAFITFGIILLLHQLGILRKGLGYYIVIVIALYIIALGIFKLNGVKKLQELIRGFMPSWKSKL